MCSSDLLREPHMLKLAEFVPGVVSQMVNGKVIRTEECWAKQVARLVKEEGNRGLLADGLRDMLQRPSPPPNVLIELDGSTVTSMQDVVRSMLSNANEELAHIAFHKMLDAGLEVDLVVASHSPHARVRESVVERLTETSAAQIGRAHV